MSKSGLADSPFFAPTQPKDEPIAPPSANPPVQKIEVKKIEKPRTKKIEQPSNGDTTTPRNHDTTVSRPHDTTADSGDDSIEVVRKAVKLLGEKAATHRFTADEKDAIADIVYGLRKKGITTSENEITRIAINYLVLDYHQSKQTSILSRVLERLNA